MLVAEIQIGRNSFRKIRYVLRELGVFLRKSFKLGSIINILGTEGVYLHEQCHTNPSRHPLGPKTNVKNKKDRLWGLWSSGEGLGGFGRIK